MAERARQESREAFVLHSYPYRETSLLVDVFAKGFGRVSVVARAARSPRSALRGVLLAFQPLALSWFGKGEVRTLARAEWLGGYPRLQGEALMCGFYLNELLLRLLPREDPHEALFDAYAESLLRLAAAGDLPAALRGFEKRLLESSAMLRCWTGMRRAARSIPASATCTSPSAGRCRRMIGAREIWWCKDRHCSTWRPATMPGRRRAKRRGR
jgi:hypothetical protein